MAILNHVAAFHSTTLLPLEPIWPCELDGEMCSSGTMRNRKLDLSFQIPCGLK